MLYSSLKHVGFYFDLLQKSTLNSAKAAIGARFTWLLTQRTFAAIDHIPLAISRLILDYYNHLGMREASGIIINQPLDNIQNAEALMQSIFRILAGIINPPLAAIKQKTRGNE